MKKTILVTGCGGAPTTSFVRSLRDADPDRSRYWLIGVDVDPYHLQRSECDVNYLCPRATDNEYIPYILEIIRRERIQFIHTQPEVEVYVIGQHRDQLREKGVVLLMPAQNTIEILRDKYKSYEVWRQAGLTVPNNVLINNEADLKKAYEGLGQDRLWLRETIGAAGKGALSRPPYDFAKAWIDMRDGWGKTVAAEHLTSRTTTWQSLWFNGQLVVGQGRQRLYWEMANRAPSGVTGITGTGVIDNDPTIAELALRCIRVVDPNPHGIFSVDFTYDQKGVPNPTEINIGKFFTTHHFITRAGANMPEIMVQLAFNEYYGPMNVINPCPPDLAWIRGMDSIPVLAKLEAIEHVKRQYEVILKNLP